MAILAFSLCHGQRPSLSAPPEARPGVPMAEMSGAQLDAVATGEVKGLRRAGWPAAEITAELKKTDGTHPQKRAVEKLIRKIQAQPAWRGTTTKVEARPAKVSAKTRKALVSLATKGRGRAMVTGKFCNTKPAALRKVHDRTVAGALHVAGFPCVGASESCSSGAARSLVRSRPGAREGSAMAVAWPPSPSLMRPLVSILRNTPA